VINAKKGPKNEAGDKTNDAEEIDAKNKNNDARERPLEAKSSRKGLIEANDNYNDARGGQWRPKNQVKVKMRPMGTKMPWTKTMMPGRGHWRPKAQEKV
jgi:hypothetical protein